MKRDIDEILKRASVKEGTFHDIRRTAISMWFANGMSEYDVMVLAGHSSFATTHKFYLAVTDDLVAGGFRSSSIYETDGEFSARH